MNKLRILFFICLFPFQLSVAQQWYHDGALLYSRDINSIQIFNQNSILLAGGYDLTLRSFYKSVDYGFSWNQTYDNYEYCVKSIAFSDTLHGYAVGEAGTLIKTDDGGISWSSITSPVASDFNEVIYTNPQTLFAVGGNRNSDTSQVILKCNNVANTWSVVLNRPGKWLKSIYFTDSLHGIAVGDSAVILKTVNGGNLWTPVVSPVQRDFNAVAFVNSTTGFIVGGQEANDSLRTILKTIDGGNTWNVIKDEINAWLRDLAFVNQDTGFAVGPLATVLKTSDGGLNWNPEILNGSLGNESFNAIKFNGPNFGIVAGKDGQVFTYTQLPTSEVITGDVYIADTTNVDFFAKANSHQVPSHLSFVFDTDTNFTNSHTTYSVSVDNDSFAAFNAYTGGIIPNTLYYYYPVLRNIADAIHGGVRHFYTGNCPYQFRALPASSVTGISAQLNGVLNGIPVPLQLKFNYGTTRNLGSHVLASPSFINDSVSHNVTANLTGLQPNTTYYYALEGNGFSNFESDTLGFYTGTNNPIVKTDPITGNSDTSLLFSGTVDRFRFPVTVSFLYGLTPALGNELPGNPYSFNDTLLHSVVQFTVGAQQQTVYYFCIKAKSAAETLYGDTFQGYCGHLYNLFNALSATNVTNSSAQLNGVVSCLTFQSILSFEYGLTPDLGSELAITPDTIIDTLTHHLKAQLNGLTYGVLYYYRLKAVTPLGLTYYSGTEQVFIGDNEVPNGDFKNWQTVTTLLPSHWYLSTDSFARVSGHNGNYALQITGPTVAMQGLPFNHSVGGAPFADRPDSFSVYMKYNIQPGDTAYVGINLLRNGNDIAPLNFYKIRGSSNGNFNRLTFPISYTSSAAPDSIIMAFVCGNAFTNFDTVYMQNSMVIDDISFNGTSANVYNYDFESWFDYTVERPDGWKCLNFFVDSANLPDVPMVSKVILNTPNDYAIQIKPNDLGGDLMPGLMATSEPFYKNTPDFEIHRRYLTLTGYYEYFPESGDSIQLSIRLKSGGKFGNTVGHGWLTFKQAQPNFGAFEVPISYERNFADPAIPDWGDIAFGNLSDQVNGHSKLIIDKLRFDGFAPIDSLVSGESSMTAMEFDDNGIKIYPNPSNGLMELEFFSSVNDESLIQIYNLKGQKQKELKLPALVSKTFFSVADMDPGFYQLRWINGAVMANKKIVVLK